MKKEKGQVFPCLIPFAQTKVMVFGNGRLPQNLSFSYDNLNLEIAKNFNYLGIIFIRTGNFS
jgi:hypothetical protein